MEHITVLIADDEVDVLEIMAKKISAVGYKVLTASDGQEAWEKIKAEIPDVILLDLRMPKLDGFMVLKNLRDNPPTKKWQPVIIISAVGELDSMKRGFDLEADHYLTKPCDMEVVLKSIRLMVSLIPQRRSNLEMDEEKK
ncbi:MAG: response regulator [Candidatus Omnitrophota bacterium]